MSGPAASSIPPIPKSGTMESHWMVYLKPGTTTQDQTDVRVLQASGIDKMLMDADGRFQALVQHAENSLGSSISTLGETVKALDAKWIQEVAKIPESAAMRKVLEGIIQEAIDPICQDIAALKARVAALEAQRTAPEVSTVVASAFQALGAVSAENLALRTQLADLVKHCRASGIHPAEPEVFLAVFS